jgi:predicted O-methyltransferase YrrM
VKSPAWFIPRCTYAPPLDGQPLLPWRRFARGRGAAVPEPSSGWPVRLVGDPRWLGLAFRKWDKSFGRSPWQAAWELRNNWLWCDYLYRMVRKYRPRLAVETGVFFGRSSTAILAAMDRNGEGHLISMDLPVAVPAGETGELVPRALRGRWELRLGDSHQLLPQALSDGVDLFFHDSDHNYEIQTFEYECAWPALRVGGILGSDDTNRSNAWADFLERHRGAYRSVEDGPAAVRAIQKLG